MKSIRTRIMALTLTAILISILTAGALSFASLRRESTGSASEMMRMICDERCESIDDYLHSVELSQEIVAHFAVEELRMAYMLAGGVVGVDGWGGHAVERDNAEVRQAALDEYLDTYIERVKRVFFSAVKERDWICSYYFRINPEISTRETGFLYVRVQNGTFVETAPTDVRQYKPDDDEYVAWFYTPLRRGEATWVEPYDNENLGRRIMSYEVPIFKENTFIGVLGVDISFEDLADVIRDIRIYETDYAFLTERDGTILYHPTLENGFRPSPDEPELQRVSALMASEDSNDEPVRYTINGEARQMFFSTIISGQKLVVTAPVQEIDRGWRELAVKFIIAMLGILLFYAAVTFATVCHITNPLLRLTIASERIARGDYNVDLDGGGDDEIGLLTLAFQHLVDHLRIYINDLNSMAYRDALTGVRNKAAFAISAQKLDDLIRLDGEDKPRFAFVMFDCNDLKKINDTYGHGRGDEYLRTACKLICDVFTQSPVFRMGGDEFAVLLTEGAYDEREAMMHTFDAHAAEVNAAAAEPWEGVSIAKGLAAYAPESDADVAQVLQRADTLMYENKKQMKASETRRDGGAR